MSQLSNTYVWPCPLHTETSPDCRSLYTIQFLLNVNLWLSNRNDLFIPTRVPDQDIPRADSFFLFVFFLPPVFCCQCVAEIKFKMSVMKNMCCQRARAGD